jgi:hypothetical protein
MRHQPVQSVASAGGVRNVTGGRNLGGSGVTGRGGGVSLTGSEAAGAREMDEYGGGGLLTGGGTIPTFAEGAGSGTGRK